MAPRVIVVGGGLAGLSATHSLLERGANVTLLDKSAFFGGNSTKATSGINGAGTATQAEQHIQDSSKIFFDDTKKSAAELARDPLIRVLAYKSGSAVDWLQDKFALDLSRVSRLGGHSQPRTHRGPAQFPGMEITMALMNKAEDIAQAQPERLQILKKAKVTKLLYENDAVVGCEYEHDGTTHRASGPVILSTGGYAADFSSDSLLKQFKPEWMNLPTTNGPHCTGDGQKMVRTIGGSLIDMEKVQVHPTGLVDPNDSDAKVKFLAAEALRGVGGLLLDNEGNRFIDELEKRSVVTQAMWKHNKFPVRLVLNGEASAEIEWHCKHYAARGLMKRFDTYDQVAKEMGIPAEHLAKTFDDYEAMCTAGKPDPFGKKFHKNFHLRKGPYYVAIMTPVLHYTMGGVEINDQAQIVKSGTETPIPGLFAAGEIAGGVHGANRLGGSSLLGCVVYGRVAGDSAAAYLLEGLSKNQVAAGRVGQIAQQLETRIKVNPEDKSVNLSFHWDDSSSSSGSPSSGSGSEPNSGTPTTESTTPTSDTASSSQSQPQAQAEPEPPKVSVYSMDEVAKHNTKDDLWVVVDGRVLNVTNFLPDHPGGEQAILKVGGTDATETFLMFHDTVVVDKYAPECVIGTVAQ